MHIGEMNIISINPEIGKWFKESGNPTNGLWDLDGYDRKKR
jgi:hypothetical protein